MGRDPSESLHEHGHVRAEHPPIGVGFVDDDVAQPPEEPRPPGVIGQHPVMEHVRVAQDHVSVFTDPAALTGVGVPVVGGGAHAPEPQGT